MNEIRCLIYGVSKINLPWVEEIICGLKKDFCVNYVGCVVWADITEPISISDKTVPIETFFHADLEGSIHNGQRLNLEKYPQYTTKFYADGEIVNKISHRIPEIFKMMDRLNAFDYETRWEILLKLISFWNNYIEQNRINVYINCCVPHGVADYVLYCLCEVKGIFFVGSTFSFFHDSAWIYNDLYDQYKELNETYGLL